MAIIDPQAIKFVNEQVRPLCEQARALIAKINAMQTQWFAGINTLTPNDGSLVQDGRDADGSSRLTGAQVNSAVGNLTAMVTASNSQIISTPCVRSLSAS